MSMMLPDGSIIPSYLSTENMGSTSGNKAFSQIALRQGEITKIVYPDDNKSVSKKVVEYDVVVSYRDGNEPAYTLNYPNCQVANLFGGIADKFRYTVRAQTKVPEKGKVVSDGSKVLVLCINGEIRRGFIVGGINEDPTVEKKDDGHNLLFEFNGIRATVNKDGELTIMYRGATDIKGDIAKSDDAKNASESKIVMNKEGGIKLLSKDDKQHLFIDHKNKKVDFLSDDEWTVKANKKITFTSGDETKLHADKNFTVDSSKNVKITSSDGVLVGNATDLMPLFETYRKAQKQMHQDLQTGLQQLSIQIGLIGAALTSGATIDPPLAAGGTAATAAVSGIVKMAASIAQFEAGAQTYISDKNKNS